MKLLCALALVILASVPSTPAFCQEQRAPYFKLKSVRQMQREDVSLQSRDYSCGAASLATLLQGYFNDNTFDEPILLQDILLRLDESELKERAIDGFSMLDLKNLAERRGYIADGIMLPKEAVNKLKGPVIILLRKTEINHFVILKGAKEGRAFITDPATGNYRLPLHELYAQWGGETLIIGRSDFGLPKYHGLSLPKTNSFASEEDSARAFNRIQFKQHSSHTLHRLSRF